jgi:cob(I)alamin adenosyltransferase
MESQVTTRRGDSGYTTALSGDSYSKSHVIMDCVGAVDELRAHLALLRLKVLNEDPAAAEFLLWLLHACFLLGSACSDPENRHPEYHQRRISGQEVARLEAEQARLEAIVRLPRQFIVSATTETAALADIACTVARRMERNIVRLRETEAEFNKQEIFIFINRISDYLYILARWLDRGHYDAVDYSVLD